MHLMPMTRFDPRVHGFPFVNSWEFGDVGWELKDEQDRGDCVERTGTVLNKTHGEEVNVVWLCPKQWNGGVVIWLDDPGKAALRNADGSVKPAVLS